MSGQLTDLNPLNTPPTRAERPWRTEKSAPPSYLRRVLGHLAARRGTWLAILAASLLLNLCGLAAPRITQAILDRVIPAEDFGLLTELLLLLLGVAAAQVGLTVWRRLTLVRLSLQIDQRCLSELFTHLLALPLSFLTAQRAGDLLGRFQGHGHVRHLLAGGLTRVAIDSVMVAVYVAVMFAYGVWLALVVLALAALFAGYTLWLTPLLKRQHRRLQEDSAAQDAHLVEALVGAELVKALAAERALQNRWEAAFAAATASNYRTQKLRQFLESGSAAVQAASTAAVFGVGAALAFGGGMTTGQLVAFSMYAGQALAPLLGLITLWEEVQQARAALDRLQEIVGQEREQHRPTRVLPAPGPIRGGVEVETVSFAYGATDAAAVLRGVSLTIRPGEWVALVGPSGSGKSTLARLLLGLHRPTRGRIRIDGHDLADIDLVRFRQQVGVVLQENLLVTGTVRDNIALGDPAPALDRVARAARLAGAHTFIESLPRGYETAVGELGLTLSGGQRQRISLARALYRNPRLLILDEPTTALDRVSVQLVHDSLREVLSGRTVLWITHQLASLQQVDRIIVLREGQIVEQGKHEELLRSKGAYFGLMARQEAG